eukprot:7119879-Alexandrium_andersonii.AAC.1
MSYISGMLLPRPGLVQWACATPSDGPAMGWLASRGLSRSSSWARTAGRGGVASNGTTPAADPPTL